MTTKKRDNLIEKAKSLITKGKYHKAFDTLKKALALDSKHLNTYDLLLEVHGQLQDDWTEEDFVMSLEWVLRKKEIEEPKFKRIHARESESFAQITGLIKTMMLTTDEREETECVENIVQQSQEALYPLIDYLLQYKEKAKALKDKMEKKEQP